MAVEPSPTPSFPLPPAELTKITTEACDGALQKALGYDHTQVATWNSTIINSVLKALIAATTPESATSTNTTTTTPSPPPYRFTVNSTIVQQGVVDKAATVVGNSADVGKRGMHSASGAYWDVNRDGMWTFKYPGGEGRGLDVVVSVTWFAMG